jgi:hypothetical protein
MQGEVHDAFQQYGTFENIFLSIKGIRYVVQKKDGKKGTENRRGKKVSGIA